MFNTRLLESINIVTAAHGDANSDLDGDWVSLKNYDGCLVVVAKEAGTAGDDISIKLLQATDVSGTSSKALNFNHLYHKVGTQTGVGVFTKVALTSETNDLDTASVNSTDLLADDVAALFVVDVRASDLDADNSFDCIQVSIEGDDLSNTCEVYCQYILYGARYPSSIPVTAIAD